MNILKYVFLYRYPLIYVFGSVRIDALIRIRQIFENKIPFNQTQRHKQAVNELAFAACLYTMCLFQNTILFSYLFAVFLFRSRNKLTIRTSCFTSRIAL